MPEENKEKIRYVQVKSEDEDKKKRRRVIIACILGTLLIIDILLMLIFIPMYFDKQKNKEDEDGYVIGDNTKTQYDHLITYLNKEINDVSLLSVDKIVSYQLDSGHMKIMTSNETYPIYVDIETTFTSYDDSLTYFENNEPNLGTFTITVNKQDYSDKQLNISSYDSVVSTVSKIEDNHYVSFTGYKENKMYSLTKGDYSDAGLYNPTQTSIEEDKLLFDFYYYLLIK